MQVYNNEDGKGGVILILDKKETKEMVYLAEAGAETNRRKKTWKKISDQLNEQACY